MCLHLLYLPAEIVIGFVTETDYVNEDMPGSINISVEVKSGVLAASVVVSFTTADSAAGNTALGKPEEETVVM